MNYPRPHSPAELSRPIAVGDVVVGKYRVERVIGIGGMGQVVAARHIELGNLFAIKLIRESFATDPSMVLRFKREAQAMARLQNDHLVRVHDVGETASGVPFMIMEYLEGRDLGAVLAERGPLPVSDAVRYIVEACDGLMEVHELGIVHRDLKPQNLFLARRPSGDKTVKVLDFGLAKSLGALDLSAGHATMQGEIIGTASYMAPEQFHGNATTRSDIWGLGVCLYRLLTGSTPFPGSGMAEIAVAVASKDFRPMRELRPEVSGPIEAIVARCLRKAQQERFETVRELGYALRDVLDEELPVTPHAADDLARTLITAAPQPDAENTERTPAAAGLVAEATQVSTVRRGSGAGMPDTRVDFATTQQSAHDVAQGPRIDPRVKFASTQRSVQDEGHVVPIAPHKSFAATKMSAQSPPVPQADPSRPMALQGPAGSAVMTSAPQAASRPRRSGVIVALSVLAVVWVSALAVIFVVVKRGHTRTTASAVTATTPATVAHAAPPAITTSTIEGASTPVAPSASTTVHEPVPEGTTLAPPAAGSAQARKSGVADRKPAKSADEPAGPLPVPTASSKTSPYDTP